eukprot:Rhum_TRINITY_DN20868_c0_g1::Rhum_TRINITY_DN20868_c0_g1_i1::g.172441::m.172441
MQHFSNTTRRRRCLLSSASPCGPSCLPLLLLPSLALALTTVKFEEKSCAPVRIFGFKGRIEGEYVAGEINGKPYIKFTLQVMGLPTTGHTWGMLGFDRQKGSAMKGIRGIGCSTADSEITFYHDTTGFQAPAVNTKAFDTGVSVESSGGTLTCSFYQQLDDGSLLRSNEEFSLAFAYGPGSTPDGLMKHTESGREFHTITPCMDAQTGVVPFAPCAPRQIILDEDPGSSLFIGVEVGTTNGKPAVMFSVMLIHGDPSYVRYGAIGYRSATSPDTQMKGLHIMACDTANPHVLAFQKMTSLTGEPGATATKSAHGDYVFAGVQMVCKMVVEVGGDLQLDTPITIAYATGRGAVSKGWTKHSVKGLVTATIAACDAATPSPVMAPVTSAPSASPAGVAFPTAGPATPAPAPVPTPRPGGKWQSTLVPGTAPQATGAPAGASPSVAPAAQDTEAPTASPAAMSSEAPTTAAPTNAPPVTAAPSPSTGSPVNSDTQAPAGTDTPASPAPAGSTNAPAQTSVTDTPPASPSAAPATVAGPGTPEPAVPSDAPQPPASPMPQAKRWQPLFSPCRVGGAVAAETAVGITPEARVSFTVGRVDGSGDSSVLLVKAVFSLHASAGVRWGAVGIRPSALGLTGSMKGLEMSLADTDVETIHFREAVAGSGQPPRGAAVTNSAYKYYARSVANGELTFEFLRELPTEPSSPFYNMVNEGGLWEMTFATGAGCVFTSAWAKHDATGLLSNRVLVPRCDSPSTAVPGSRVQQAGAPSDDGSSNEDPVRDVLLACLSIIMFILFLAVLLWLMRRCRRDKARRHLRDEGLVSVYEHPTRPDPETPPGNFANMNTLVLDSARRQSLRDSATAGKVSRFAPYDRPDPFLDLDNDSASSAGLEMTPLQTAADVGRNGGPLGAPPSFRNSLPPRATTRSCYDPLGRKMSFGGGVGGVPAATKPLRQRSTSLPLLKRDLRDMPNTSRGESFSFGSAKV